MTNTSLVETLGLAPGTQRVFDSKVQQESSRNIWTSDKLLQANAERWPSG